jgi:hypothetical protein
VWVKSRVVVILFAAAAAAAAAVGYFSTARDEVDDNERSDVMPTRLVDKRIIMVRNVERLPFLDFRNVLQKRSSVMEGVTPIFGCGTETESFLRVDTLLNPTGSLVIISRLLSLLTRVA